MGAEEFVTIFRIWSSYWGIMFLMSSMFQVLEMGQSKLLTRRSAVASVGGPIGTIGVEQDNQGSLQILISSPFPTAQPRPFLTALVQLECCASLVTSPKVAYNQGKLSSWHTCQEEPEQLEMSDLLSSASQFSPIEHRWSFPGLWILARWHT